MKEFRLEYRNSKIRILCDKNLKNQATEELKKNYNELERYIQRDPFFLTSYEPVSLLDNAPRIARIMANASKRASVGPMASVAGAFSEIIGDFLLRNGAEEVVVENGGDIFLRLRSEKTVGIYAGDSAFSERIGFRIMPEETPLAICTSSGSVGHSVSFGDSDSVTVVAESCSLADSAATSVGNSVKGENAIEKGIKRAKKIQGIDGILIIRGDELGSYGKIPEIIEV